MVNTPFVLIAKQRSGSTWLADLLNTYPDMRMYGELFLDRPRHNDIRLDEFPGHLQYASQHRFIPRPSRVFRYLDLFYQQPALAAGFKLMYSQVKRFPEILHYLHAHRIPVIHLVRRNYLDTIISLETAQERQRWHASHETGSRALLAPIHLNPTATLRQMIRLERQQKIVASFLSVLSLDYLQVTYEHLCEATPDTMADIHHFLHLEPQDTPLQSVFRKLVTTSQRATIENYEELKNMLSQTPYIGLLKE